MKQISWSNVTLQTIAGYNVFSVVLVFSMLSLGCILISNLVVANLLMYIFTSRYDSTLLGRAFLHQKCFCMRYHHFCKDKNSIVTQIKHK